LLKELYTVTYCDGNRRIEEQAYVFFGDFLDDCEGASHKVPYIRCVYKCLTVAGDVECTLEDILIFCTGADSIPLGGFHKKIELSFLNNGKILPTSSTCFLKLKLPTCHNSNEHFNEKMILGIRGSSCFGLV